MTDEELKDLVASLAVNAQKTDQQLAETSRQIQEMKRQVGDLHRKWGTFTEGMLMPSIEKILQEKFQIEVTSPGVKVTKQDQSIELDAFGYVNSTINTAVVVEVKSQLKSESIIQMLAILERFSYFFPDHAGKKLYGIMACINAPQNLRNELRKKGIYLAMINYDILEIQEPANFIPKDYNHL
jgi:Protein of unknown function (DUF3782)